MGGNAITAPSLAHAYTHSGPRLHYVMAGSGRPVLLLHGFPEFWFGWRHQIEPLAAAGYRVIAPDQRGYDLSDKPASVRAYRIDDLAADVLRLADEVAPGEKVSLVGHDWGAGVAWWLAIHAPERLERLAILNAPHPAVFMRALKTNPRQWLRSWYILFLQVPGLPEWLLSRGDYRGMARSLQASSRPGTFTAAELARYREAWGQPGALTASINWYRAAMRYRVHLRRSPRVVVPTLILWGVRDVALGRELVEPSRALCDDGRLVCFEQAT
ncbi:MAG TPA: alpha/beta hydrolase, partial [Dehalococcoidia bacterium]